MHQEIRRGLYGLVFAAGLAALGSSEASAAETSGQAGLAGGNQITPVITTPVTVQGNPIALIGDPTTSTGTGGSDPREGTTPATPTTTGQGSLAGGNQITPVITTPVTVAGNPIALIGDPTTSQNGTSQNGTGQSAAGGTDPAAPTTTGQGSLAGGNQIAPVLTTPVTVAGNPITLIGDPSTGQNGTGGTATPEGTPPAHAGARTDQDTPGSIGNGQDPAGTPGSVPADGGSTSGTHGIAPAAVGGGSVSAGLVSGSTPPTDSGADGARSGDRTPSATTASTVPADHAGAVGARTTGGDGRGPAAGTGGAHDCLTPGAPADGAATGFADDSSATGTDPTASAPLAELATGGGVQTCSPVVAGAVTPAAATTAAGFPAPALGAALLALVGGAAVHRWDRIRRLRR